MGQSEIRVRGCEWVDLVPFRDGRGVLTIAKDGGRLPFRMAKFYLIDPVCRAGNTRGNHAHRKLTNALFCLQGSFKLHLDDGRRRQTVSMTGIRRGILIGPRVWLKMGSFRNRCRVLVVSSGGHRPSDYIRDYSEFQRRYGGK
jgi:hypothetical protein